VILPFGAGRGLHDLRAVAAEGRTVGLPSGLSASFQNPKIAILSLSSRAMLPRRSMQYLIWNDKLAAREGLDTTS
jgi:hypothetical protein